MPTEAKKERKISQETQETILKVVGYGALILLGKKALNDLFGSSGGRVTKVKYHYWRTQLVFMSVGGGKFISKPDPWDPSVIADKLYETMHGIAGEPGGTPAGYGADNPRELAWKELLTLSKDRVRWLHNYWLETIDPEETLYRWVKGEIPAPFSSEDYTKQAVLERLINFGVGF